MAQNENVTVIENAVAQMNSGNLEGYLEMYGDDLTLHGYPPEVQGKEGVSAFYAAFAKALPDIELANAQETPLDSHGVVTAKGLGLVAFSAAFVDAVRAHRHFDRDLEATPA